MNSSIDTMPDVETPKTDALIEEMRCGYGIPKCAEWDRLVEHARELERLAYSYRAVAVAISHRRKGKVK